MGANLTNFSLGCVTQNYGRIYALNTLHVYQRSHSKYIDHQEFICSRSSRI